VTGAQAAPLEYQLGDLGSLAVQTSGSVTMTRAKVFLSLGDLLSPVTTANETACRLGMGACF
jgi:hypothetical protein